MYLELLKQVWSVLRVQQPGPRVTTRLPGPRRKAVHQRTLSTHSMAACQIARSVPGTRLARKLPRTRGSLTDGGNSTLGLQLLRTGCGLRAGRAGQARSVADSLARAWRPAGSCLG
jgi:hypothetical protein